MSYTLKLLAVTEQAQAQMMCEDNVNRADIESNNGGRSYARNVERILKDDFDSNKTVIRSFFQSQNKQARIIFKFLLKVNQHVYVPET